MGYVEAYKVLQEELEAAKVNTAAVDSSTSDEMALLKKELEEKEQLRQEKELALVEMAEELREKKEKIACLEPALEALESKAGEVESENSKQLLAAEIEQKSALLL